MVSGGLREGGVGGGGGGGKVVSGSTEFWGGGRGTPSSCSEAVVPWNTSS